MGGGIKSWDRPAQKVVPAHAPAEHGIPTAKAGSTVVVPAGATTLRRIGRAPGAH